MALRAMTEATLTARVFASASAVGFVAGIIVITVALSQLRASEIN